MTTPYMSLDWPVPGITAGPTYAQMHETAVDLIDAHDHSPGKGAPVPSTGLNINADLAFGGFDATALRMTRFNNQTGALSASLVRGVYVLSGELHYIDGSGNDVALTSGGSVAGATGNISGLASPAAATWDSVNKIFAFTQNSNFPAKLQGGDLIIYETVSAPSNAVTIKSPSSLGAAYSITLPSAVPATNALLYGSSSAALSFLAAPASTSLLQQTSGGALSWVTTLPSGLTLPSPVFSGTATGTYTLGGTPTIASPTISSPTLSGTVAGTPTYTNMAIGTMTPANWPSFRTYRSTNQNIASASATEVVFDDDSTAQNYDTNANFNTGTGRFTPTAAGKYSVTAVILLGGANLAEDYSVYIVKNGAFGGAAIMTAVCVPLRSGVGNQSIATLTAEFSMNGSTDYLSVFVQSTTDTSYNVQSLDSKFYGHRCA